jgi:Mg-chelatase subunit ChlD
MTEPKDLILCIDASGSMHEVIQQVLAYLPQFVMYSYEKIDRIGLVTFCDHPEDEDEDEDEDEEYIVDWPYRTYGMTENLEEFVYWIKNIEVGDGGDWAESIACAYDQVLKLSDNSHKWIITDSYPHNVDRDNLCDLCVANDTKMYKDAAILWVNTRGERDIEMWNNYDKRAVVRFDEVFSSSGPNEEVVDYLLGVPV